MFPPVFEVCSADADVQTNLGTSPCRLYPFGEAPQGVTTPYATWATVIALPELYIDCVPDIDQFTVQIEVFADTASAARDAAKALRDVVEQYAHVTGYNGESRDPDTRHYQYSLDVDWFVHRDLVS